MANRVDPDETAHYELSWSERIQQTTNLHCLHRFVCVEVLRLSQPNGVMSSAVSLPNHMFTGQT